MEHTHTNPITAAVLGVFSMFSTFFAWVTMPQVQIGVTIGASIAAIISGCFAGRYYWYATQEKKENLKNLKNSRNEKN